MLSAILFLFLTAAPFNVLVEEQRSGYKCQLIEYKVPDGDPVRTYLLVPDSASKRRKAPALVCLHDHGARFDIGKEKLVRPIGGTEQHIVQSSRQWIDDNFDGVWFADSLASLGYVVIVPDMLYWGERRSRECDEWSRSRFGAKADNEAELKKTVYEGQREVYDSLSRKGVTWAVKTLQEDAYAAWLLSRLDYVDSQRIGCFGWSMGAHRAWLLTAFCPYVKTGVALCWMTLKSTCANPPKASDFSMLIPGLRDRYDFPDIALALAPKPFCFLNASEDHLFPKAETDSAFAAMQSVYSSLSLDGVLTTEYFEGDHHCGKAVQKRICSYLEDNL